MRMNNAAVNRRVAILIVTALTLIAFVFTMVWGIVSLANRSDRIAQQAQEVARKADQVARKASAIETSRRTALIRSCREQNVRHDRTIEQLDRIIAATPKRRRARAQRRRAGTVALIQALAPRQDCVRRAERLIDTPAEQQANGSAP